MICLTSSTCSWDGWEGDQGFLDKCHYTVWSHREVAHLLHDALVPQ